MSKNPYGTLGVLEHKYVTVRLQGTDRMQILYFKHFDGNGEKWLQDQVKEGKVGQQLEAHAVCFDRRFRYTIS